MLPALGVPDSLTLGHRGATHSLAVALAVVVIVTLLAMAVRLPARRVAIGAFLAIGSHAILDSLTRGPGVAWLWPFSSARFPTFPILPMAPLDHLLSTRGLVCSSRSILVFCHSPSTRCDDPRIAAPGAADLSSRCRAWPAAPSSTVT